MRRKGQVFSMPVKVSIGQDRNKKDPHRGRKPFIRITIVASSHKIEIKKIPIGDEVSFLVIYLICKKREFLIVTLEGSRTSISNVYISKKNLKQERKNELRVHL